jgi:hypothetical protein
VATLNECMASAELHLGFHKPRPRDPRGIAARREAMRVRACCRPVRGGAWQFSDAIRHRRSRLSRFTRICNSEYGSKLRLGNREHGPHELRDLKIALSRIDLSQMLTLDQRLY